MLLSSSANPTTYGQPVSLTATVSSASGTPSGQVIFSEGSNLLGTVALSSGSPFKAVLTKSDFTIGSHSLTAAYSGDEYFKGSTAAIIQTINAIPSSGGGGGGSYPTTRTVTTIGFSGSSSLVTDMQGNLKTAARLTTADGKVVLAITNNTKLSSQTGGFLTALSISQLTSAPAVPDNTTLICAYNLGPEGAKFTPGVNLTFNYDPAGLPANVMEDNLTIAYYDGLVCRM